MRLNVKALAITGGVLWAACAFLVGSANLIWSGYGNAMLDLVASVYPGYHGPAGFGSVIVVTMYAAIDGLVCGAVFAWLYNTVLGRGASPAA
jgi:hypothetical protein